MNSLRDAVLAELVGGVWHITSQGRFRRILELGAILPEPDIPEGERWGTAVGPEGYPYVRSIGGVSLFDFRGFEAESYSEEYPTSSWGTFVPCLDSWDSAIWIEIDHECLGPAFISGVELLTRRKAEGSFRRIMPLIEAAHIGPLPCLAFKRYFSVRREPDNSPLVAALKAGRLRASRRQKRSDSMDALQGEIVKLLNENGQMHAGRIMNKLNGQHAGWDVNLEVVERALHQLEEEYVVECMWRLKETPIQSDPPGGGPTPDRSRN